MLDELVLVAHLYLFKLTYDQLKMEEQLKEGASLPQKLK